MEEFQKYMEADLTDMQNHVLPDLQSFCSLEEKRCEGDGNSRWQRKMEQRSAKSCVDAKQQLRMEGKSREKDKPEELIWV